MRDKLNHALIDSLVEEGKSYKEIVEITGHKKKSVYRYCWQRFGKLDDRNKSRRQSIPVTDEQMEYLFGTLMGDGNLVKFNKNGKSVTGRTNHSTKQLEYCRHKAKILGDLVYDVKFQNVYNKKYNKTYGRCYFCVKPNTNLLELYNMFYYKDGKRDVPMDLSLLTPKAMAWWFMDDGTASSGCSISIATCSFSQEGLCRLKDFLKEKYDINVRINKEKKLYFSAESGRKFYELTKEYVIPEMMYKFRFLRNCLSKTPLNKGNL